MAVLGIDFETRSTLNLLKTGVYPYAAHATTDIWCMAYVFDDEPVALWTPDDQYGMPRLVDHVMRGGEVASYREEDAAAVVKQSEVLIRIEFGIGDGEATFWSCDLTYDYVKINTDYRT